MSDSVHVTPGNTHSKGGAHTVIGDTDIKGDAAIAKAALGSIKVVAILAEKRTRFAPGMASSLIYANSPPGHPHSLRATGSFKATIVGRISFVSIVRAIGRTDTLSATDSIAALRAEKRGVLARNAIAFAPVTLPAIIAMCQVGVQGCIADGDSMRVCGVVWGCVADGGLVATLGTHHHRGRDEEWTKEQKKNLFHDIYLLYLISYSILLFLFSISTSKLVICSHIQNQPSVHN